jgi:hypothetical protein
MSTCALTRRAAICAVGALALSPAAALAQPPVRFRNVEVDVGPLRASEGDPTAAWVAEALPGQLALALGPNLSPGDRAGATLIARITLLYLGPQSGGTGPGGSSQDTIEGVLIVQGPRGSIAAETPLRAITSYYPNAVDNALIVQSNYYRVAALAQAFAYWVPRQLGL